MIQVGNAISGAELNEIQRVFDLLTECPWFVRNPSYEQELAAYMIHLYLNGIRQPEVLYDMCERPALKRARATKAA
jgi:hypothetical protein